MPRRCPRPIILLLTRLSTAELLRPRAAGEERLSGAEPIAQRRCRALLAAPRLEALPDPDANPMMSKAETHARAAEPRLSASTFPRRRVTVARNERACARRS